MKATFGVIVDPSTTGCLQTLAARSATERAATTTVGGKVVEYRWTVDEDTVRMSLNGKMIKSGDDFP